MNEAPTIGILYVDDEAVSLKYFREAFENVGLIFTADNPIEGLQVFKDNQDKIQIVLSDHRMKEENGVEFLSKVQQHNPQATRILVTAIVDQKYINEALDSGVIDSHFSKPWDPEVLREAIMDCAA